MLEGTKNCVRCGRHCGELITQGTDLPFKNSDSELVDKITDKQQTHFGNVEYIYSQPLKPRQHAHYMRYLLSHSRGPLMY